MLYIVIIKKQFYQVLKNYFIKIFKTEYKLSELDFDLFFKAHFNSYNFLLVYLLTQNILTRSN